MAEPVYYTPQEALEKFKAIQSDDQFGGDYRLNLCMGLSEGRLRWVSPGRLSASAHAIESLEIEGNRIRLRWADNEVTLSASWLLRRGSVIHYIRSGDEKAFGLLFDGEHLIDFNHNSEKFAMIEPEIVQWYKDNPSEDTHSGNSDNQLN